MRDKQWKWNLPEATLLIKMKYYALSYRTPKQVQFSRLEASLLDKKHSYWTAHSFIDLPLVNSWDAQESREWSNKLKVRKGSVWLCQGLTRQVKWDCGSWSPWRRMLFQANQPMKEALLVIQKSTWPSSCFHLQETRSARMNDGVMNFFIFFQLFFFFFLYI